MLTAFFHCGPSIEYTNKKQIDTNIHMFAWIMNYIGKA